MTQTMTAQPRYETHRRPELPSYAGRVARVAAALGRPLIPWQRHAAHLVGEHSGGRRVHPYVVVTTQRQVGKSSWLLAEAVERCLEAPRLKVWYTAQNGQYARDRWAELAEQLTDPACPLRRLVRSVRWTNGAERVRFVNGSELRPFPPTKDALHSTQSDLVIVDEAWRFDDERGAELEQAIRPTQATRPGAQVIIVSTAGTLDSTWLRRLVDRGRAGDPAVTYLEYGIPDDADPLDLDAVAAAHPGVPYLIPREFLATEAARLADRPGEFGRAYGNRWSAVLERAIPAVVWAEAATPDPLPDDGELVLAAALAQDGTRGAIVGCAGAVADVVESRPGTSWVAGRMLELVERWDPSAVLVRHDGPSAVLAEDLELAGVELLPLPTRDYAAACERTMQDLTARRLRYRIHPGLDAAADAAAQRPVGDGWAWAPKRSSAPIPELEAMTLAWHGWTHRPVRKRPAASMGGRPAPDR